MLSNDNDAIKGLLSVLDTGTKQLQKASPATSSRNLVLVFKIFTNISTTRKARDAIAKHLTSAGRDIFSVILGYLAAATKQPAAPTDLYLSAVAILKNFCASNPEIRASLATRWRWMEGMGAIAKAERDKGNRVRGTRTTAGSDQWRIRAEKIDEVLGMLR